MSFLRSLVKGLSSADINEREAKIGEIAKELANGDDVTQDAYYFGFNDAFDMDENPTARQIEDALKYRYYHHWVEPLKEKHIGEKKAYQIAERRYGSEKDFVNRGMDRFRKGIGGK